MADLSFPNAIVSSEEGLEFVHYAFNNLPQMITGDSAHMFLEMLYDEYMGMAQYTAAALHENPLMPMRQWGAESYGPVSKERERMELFVSLRIPDYFAGMTWGEFNKLNPEQTE